MSETSVQPAPSVCLSVGYSGSAVGFQPFKYPVTAGASSDTERPPSSCQTIRTTAF